MDVPTFNTDTKPAEIRNAIGLWLAGRIGFRWLKSRSELRRSERGQTARIVLQPRRASGAGIGTWVSPRVMIEDDALAAWRNTHPEDTVMPSGPFQTWVFNSLLINISDIVTVELSGVADGPAGAIDRPIGDFVDWLENVGLPTIKLFNEPTELATMLPGRWLTMVGPDTIEFELSRDRADSARILVERVLSRPDRGLDTRAKRLERFQVGWEAEHPPQTHPGTPDLAAIGWLSRRHQLISPTDLVT